MLAADFDLQINNDGELINFEEAGLCNSMVRSKREQQLY
jgi:hypothetical protein